MARQRSRVLRSRISTPRCESAKGRVRKFYLCMDHSGEYWALFSCGVKYDPDSQSRDFRESLQRPALVKVLWGILEREDFRKMK